MVITVMLIMQVAKKDYEKEGITPPKGQELRKWEH